MDEPTEKPVKDGAWWRNLGIGIAATTVLAVAAIFLAPVIATVAVAAVGTAGVTAYVSWKDAKTGHGRGLGQFAFELLVGGVAGALLGAGTVVFWPVITATVTAASEQAAFLGTYYFGGSALFNSYVLPLIPTIGKVTGFTIFGLNGINIWNDIYGLCTGDNVLLDTVFNGNEEVYGAAQIVLEMTTEGMHQMASDSMARKASTGKEANGEEDGAGKASTGSKTSTADMDGDEPEQPNTNNNKVNEEPLLDASTKQGGTYIESGTDASIKNIDEFIGGNKSFDDVLDDYAKVYADKINSNQAWSWDDTIPGGENLTKKQRSIIKQQAIDGGLIPDIKVTKVDGMRYGFADFESAGVVKETQYLPENMWKMSDAEQFKWLDEQIGGTVEGYTWHHTEIPGKMQLVPTGIHNITTHNGGRTAGMWADAPR